MSFKYMTECDLLKCWQMINDLNKYVEQESWKGYVLKSLFAYKCKYFSIVLGKQV